MVFDQKLLDQVSIQAKESTRLRMNYNFHQSLEGNSVIFECKEGSFVPHEVEGVLKCQTMIQ